MAANGFVIPGTPIAVDFWNVKKCPQAKLFFLTHFHSDHTVGLSQAWSFPLYTSPITAKLLIAITGVSPSLIKSLEVGEHHILPLDEDEKEVVTVQAVDANHCPGSIMIIFQGYFGNVLCTGDFRFHRELVTCINLPQIDILYLDNTFCNPIYTFCTKENATEEVLQRIHYCFQHCERIMLGIDNIGKEELLKKIVEETKCKINVNYKRMKILQVLGLSDIATTDANTKIFAVPTFQVNEKNMKKWNMEKRSCAILPTARFIGLDYIPYSECGHICVIPYSNHSSYDELIEFVRFVRPCTIEPFVGKCTKGIFSSKKLDRTDMKVFANFLLKKPLQEISIPDSVWRFMKKPLLTLPLLINSRKRSTKRKYNRPASKGVQFGGCDDFSSISISLDSIEKKPDKILTKSHEHNKEEYMWEVVHITGRTPPQVWHIPEKNNCIQLSDTS